MAFSEREEKLIMACYEQFWGKDFQLRDAGYLYGFDQSDCDDLALMLVEKRVFTAMGFDHTAAFTPAGRELARELLFKKGIDRRYWTHEQYGFLSRVFQATKSGTDAAYVESLAIGARLTFKQAPEIAKQLAGRGIITLSVGDKICKITPQSLPILTAVFAKPDQSLKTKSENEFEGLEKDEADFLLAALDDHPHEFDHNRWLSRQVTDPTRHGKIIEKLQSLHVFDLFNRKGSTLSKEGEDLAFRVRKLRLANEALRELQVRDLPENVTVDPTFKRKRLTTATTIPITTDTVIGSHLPFSSSVAGLTQFQREFLAHAFSVANGNDQFNWHKVAESMATTHDFLIEQMGSIKESKGYIHYSENPPNAIFNNNGKEIARECFEFQSNPRNKPKFPLPTGMAPVPMRLMTPEQEEFARLQREADERSRLEHLLVACYDESLSSQMERFSLEAAAKRAGFENTDLATGYFVKLNHQEMVSLISRGQGKMEPKGTTEVKRLRKGKWVKEAVKEAEETTSHGASNPHTINIHGNSYNVQNGGNIIAVTEKSVIGTDRSQQSNVPVTDANTNPSESRGKSKMTKLWGMLQASVKVVPINKYAVGVVGIVAAVQLCLTFVRDWKIAVYGAVIMIALMAALIFLGWFKQHGSKAAKPVVIGFLWFVVIAFCATLFLLFTTFFFGWPEHAEMNFSSEPTKALNMKSMNNLQPDISKKPGNEIPVSTEPATKPTGWKREL